MLPPPKGWVCRHRRGRTLTRAATEGRMFEAVNKYGERYEVWPDKAAAFGRWAGVKETSGNFARRRRHCHRHQLPLPPPPLPASSSPGGKQAKPALLRPCALHPRPCELPASLLPASGVAGDAGFTLCASSRGTGARLPSRIRSCLCCSCMAGCGCADGLGCRKPEWRPASRKIKSGLLPQFQVARLAP